MRTASMWSAIGSPSRDPSMLKTNPTMSPDCYTRQGEFLRCDLRLKAERWEPNRYPGRAELPLNILTGFVIRQIAKRLHRDLDLVFSLFLRTAGAINSSLHCAWILNHKSKPSGVCQENAKSELRIDFVPPAPPCFKFHDIRIPQQFSPVYFKFLEYSLRKVEIRVSPRETERSCL
jgi:hypothetical protein